MVLSDSVQFPEAFRSLYEGEVYGEALLLALVDAAKTNRERLCFMNILQLETETKARLRPVLVRQGVEICESDIDLSKIRTLVDMYQQNSWLEFAVLARDDLLGSVHEYEAIASAGHGEEQSVLDEMVEHERAILAFFTAELNRDESSLDAVLRLLRYPIEGSAEVGGPHSRF